MMDVTFKAKYYVGSIVKDVQFENEHKIVGMEYLIDLEEEPLLRYVLSNMKTGNLILVEEDEIK